MPFRAPGKIREWLLLFSPTLVIWLATLIGFVIPAPGSEWKLYMPFFGVSAGSVLALLICLIAGYAFTKPTLELPARRAWGLLAALALAVVNFGIAFAGCAVVLR